MGHHSRIFLIGAVAIVVMLVVAGAVLSLDAFLTYGEKRSESDRLAGMVQQRDITGINHFVLETRSLQTKLVAMNYLRDYKDPSSIPALASLLTFRGPFYLILDSDLRGYPEEIRKGAFDSLAGYCAVDSSEINALLQGDDALGRVYAAALLWLWGKQDGEAVFTAVAEGASGLSGREILWIRSYVQGRVAPK